MKKSVSIILSVSMLIAMIFTTTSCSHECTFETEWSSNDDTHWHACEHDGCTKKLHEAVHSWDKGETTTRPAKNADGIKTYLCKECDQTKEEPVKYAHMSFDEWRKAFSSNAFENCTYTETSTVYANETTTTTTVVYKFTKDKVYVEITEDEYTKSANGSGDEARKLRNSLASSLTSMVLYDEFEYDYDNNVYRLDGYMYISSIDTIVDKATLIFKDSKLIKMKYNYEFERKGTTIKCESTIIFSDYGTTEI